MSKIVNSVSFKGQFDLGLMEITEIKKESSERFDLNKYLAPFNGKEVSIVVKEETPADPKEEE